jgi:hypothetical protein
MEIQRQINFQQTMKDRALEKYFAKVAEIDDKIERLTELKEAAENGATTVSKRKLYTDSEIVTQDIIDHAQEISS